jgi:hypothetical protein
MMAADTVVSLLSLQTSGQVRLEVPPEPSEMREGLREILLAGGDPREGFSNDICLAVWLWHSWRSSLEPAGLDREAFVDVVVSYGREIWLWIIGERRWEQCIEGLSGRVERRLPTQSSQ